MSDKDYTRESQAAIAKKRRELDRAEAKFEASKEMLEKFLGKALKTDQERLAAEMLDGVKHGVANESLERILRGENAREVLKEPDPTGKERYPWDED